MMRILALSFFDPASVVLSHRDLMRKAGHDMRLAVVRAYTERQRQADYVLERLTVREKPLGAGVLAHRESFFEKMGVDLDELREFARSADVIQFHPGIGRGDGDWASQEGAGQHPLDEIYKVDAAFGIADVVISRWHEAKRVAFFHGSRNTRSRLSLYVGVFGQEADQDGNSGFRTAASTIDYAEDLNAAYLPPFVDVGDLRAPLRQDDDPLVIAHCPTDRIACSTEVFLKAAQETGAVVRLGEGMAHSEILQLKSECNAGFDHLRGAFSTNTLENAALGLVPLFGLHSRYRDRLRQKKIWAPWFCVDTRGPEDLASNFRDLIDYPDGQRDLQTDARSWWETHFSATPTTQRLIEFYESL